jgi:arginine deiminase
MKDLEQTIASTVQSAVQAQAKVALIEGLGGVERLADEMLNVLLKAKVKRDFREVRVIDAVLQDALRDEMKRLIEELFNEQRAEIRKLLTARIRKDASSIAEQIVGQMAASSYRFVLKVDE